MIEVQRHNYNQQFNKLGNATGTVWWWQRVRSWEEADFVLAEICSSSLKEEEGVMRTIMTIPLALLPLQDQGGKQHGFCYELHKVKVDLI